MDFRNLDDIQKALFEKKLRLPDLVAFYFENAQKSAHLNAFVELWADDALERAAFLQSKMEADPSSVGPLFGAVLSLKDNICRAGFGVSAGSKILENYVSPFSATVVERLEKAGAIFIGRTNCDQFGMGSSNENSFHGTVKNFLDKTRVSGGSSGGAAVSVQMFACLAAIGTDTGGSIRQPAGFCGLFGLKPTYGRVSRHGLVAYGSSFDSAGVISKTVEDAARLFDAMAGPDDFDMTASQRPVAPFDAYNKDSKKQLRVAIFSELEGGKGMTRGTSDAIENFTQLVDNEQVSFEKIDFGLLDFVVPTYYVLTTAEASSNLSRYDGVRFGHRSEKAKTLEETHVFSRSEGFSEEVKRRILLGTFVLSSGFYDAYFEKAQRARRLIRDRVLAILEDFDFIALPTSPDVAWRFGEKSDDPTAMYLADIFTVLANLAGVPAVSLPIGNCAETGMPVGLQFLGKPFSEAELLAFSKEMMAIRTN